MKNFHLLMLFFLVCTSCNNHPYFIDLESDKLRRLLELDIVFVENLTDDILTAHFLEAKSSREIFEKFHLSEVNNQAQFVSDADIDHFIEISASQEEFISKLSEARESLKSEFIFSMSSEAYERIMVYSSLMKILEFDYPDHPGYSNLRSGKNCAAGIFGGILVGGLAGCRAGVEIGALFASPMKGCIGGAIIGALGGGLTGSVAAGCWN